ncbi:TatD family hydrolase [Psychrobacillus sp. L3]|uniref:TatD family hydrolase n=1 Tax=Psychrobacillus sp. L3 TaxID=3236891 RepID=UPI0036F35E42
MLKIIDAHIHLDHYNNQEIKDIIECDSSLEALISVSFDLDSSKKNRELAKIYSKVKPAYGYHPEQTPPTENQMDELFSWIKSNQSDMVAVGEVGLPYYLRKEQKLTTLQHSQYIDLLEAFIKLSKELEKPIILHAVYEDAPIVCDLLEEYSVSKAHFHWFKGDSKTIQRMAENGYYISVTPDVLYEEEIQQLVQSYPLQQIMVETDGPWPFEGPFTGKMTHPSMMKESIKTIAEIKKLPIDEIYHHVLYNTKSFFFIL